MTFSQFGEDAIIANFFGSFTGSFLDVGAHNGEYLSNTRALALAGWTGCCVEPDLEPFAALATLYAGNSQVTLVHAAITADGRPRHFWRAPGGWSTLDRKHAARPEFTQTPFWVPTLSTKALHGLLRGSPDFMSVDCEAMDMEIVGASRELLAGTRLLCYEHDIPGSTATSEQNAAWARVLHYVGMTKVVGRTSANTLVTRP